MSSGRDASTALDRAAAAPNICPYCFCGDLSAPGRVTAATYYRCNGCGQIWNPARLRTRPPLDFRRR